MSQLIKSIKGQELEMLLQETLTQVFRHQVDFYNCCKLWGMLTITLDEYSFLVQLDQDISKQNDTDTAKPEPVDSSDGSPAHPRLSAVGDSLHEGADVETMQDGRASSKNYHNGCLNSLPTVNCEVSEVSYSEFVNHHLKQESVNRKTILTRHNEDTVNSDLYPSYSEAIRNTSSGNLLVKSANTTSDFSHPAIVLNRVTNCNTKDDFMLNITNVRSLRDHGHDAVACNTTAKNNVNLPNISVTENGSIDSMIESDTAGVSLMQDLCIDEHGEYMLHHDFMDCEDLAIVKKDNILSQRKNMSQCEMVHENQTNRSSQTAHCEQNAHCERNVEQSINDQDALSDLNVQQSIHNKNGQCVENAQKNQSAQRSIDTQECQKVKQPQDKRNAEENQNASDRSVIDSSCSSAEQKKGKKYDYAGPKAPRSTLSSLEVKETPPSTSGQAGKRGRRLKRAVKTDSTKQATKYGFKKLIDWLQLKQYEVDFAAVSCERLAELLCQFYEEVNTHKGTLKPSSLNIIRAGINRCLADKYGRNINVIRDHEFQKANRIFRCRCVQLEGRYAFSETGYKLTSPDAEKLKSYFSSWRSDPRILVECVWFLLTAAFGKRGGQKWTEITKHHFAFYLDEHGNEKIIMKPTVGQQVVKIANILNRTAIEVLKVYFNRLHPFNSSLFQRPMRCHLTKQDMIWYSNEPIGVNMMSGLWHVICRKAGIRTKYNIAAVEDTELNLVFPDQDQESQIALLPMDLNPVSPGVTKMTEGQVAKIRNGVKAVKLQVHAQSNVKKARKKDTNDRKSKATVYPGDTTSTKLQVTGSLTDSKTKSMYSHMQSNEPKTMVINSKRQGILTSAAATSIDAATICKDAVNENRKCSKGIVTWVNTKSTEVQITGSNIVYKTKYMYPHGVAHTQSTEAKATKIDFPKSTDIVTWVDTECTEYTGSHKDSNATGIYPNKQSSVVTKTRVSTPKRKDTVQDDTVLTGSHKDTSKYPRKEVVTQDDTVLTGSHKHAYAPSMYPNIPSSDSNTRVSTPKRNDIIAQVETKSTGRVTGSMYPHTQSKITKVVIMSPEKQDIVKSVDTKARRDQIFVKDGERVAQKIVDRKLAKEESISKTSDVNVFQGHDEINGTPKRNDQVNPVVVKATEAGLIFEYGIPEGQSLHGHSTDKRGFNTKDVNDITDQEQLHTTEKSDILHIFSHKSQVDYQKSTSQRQQNIAQMPLRQSSPTCESIFHVMPDNMDLNDCRNVKDENIVYMSHYILDEPETTKD